MKGLDLASTLPLQRDTGPNKIGYSTTTNASDWLVMVIKDKI